MTCCSSTAHTRSPLLSPRALCRRTCCGLEPETDFRDAALVEPLACVVQGIEDTQLKAGQRVLVIGAGPIGLMFVALARHLGCEVTVAGRGAERLATARRLGAELGLQRQPAEPLGCGHPAQLDLRRGH